MLPSAPPRYLPEEYSIPGALGAPPRLTSLPPPRGGRCEVTTTLNATVVGAPSPIVTAGSRGGYLAAVTPIAPANVSVPRGRVYMEAYLTDVAGNRIVCVWRGYVACDSDSKPRPCGPVSVPGIPLDPSWNIIGVATQTGQGSGATFAFQTLVTDEAPAGGYIHNVDPCQGAGEMVTVAVSNPAAGSDPAVQTMPSKACRRFMSMVGTLTAAAVAANRNVQLFLDRGAATSPIMKPELTAAITSGQQKDLEFAVGFTATTTPNSLQQGAVMAMLMSGDRVRVVTSGLQGADQWTNVAFTYEELATP